MYVCVCVSDFTGLAVLLHAAPQKRKTTSLSYIFSPHHCFSHKHVLCTADCLVLPDWMTRNVRCTFGSLLLNVSEVELKQNTNTWLQDDTIIFTSLLDQEFELKHVK